MGNFATLKSDVWKNNIKKLLFSNEICGICFSQDKKLNSLDTLYHIEQNSIEKSLREILQVSFGNVATYLPTNYICEECIQTILRSYFFSMKIKSNYTILQKYINHLSQQAEVSSEKELLLALDNVNNLNVPRTVTVSEIQANVIQILPCEFDNRDTDKLKLKTENSQPKYQCPYCGKDFYNFDIFKSHRRKHNEIYYRCHKCSKRFKDFNELIQHRNVKHFDDLTACSKCKIILFNQQDDDHDKEHKSFVGNDGITCTVCGECFDLKTDLEKHLSTKHTFESCSKCFKTVRTSKLKKHRCSYKCSECLDECVHDEFLASYRTQHLEKQTIFECPQCDYTYSTKCQIICHANNDHLNHFPYTCDLCSDIFSSKANLTVHTFKIHGNVKAFDDNDNSATTSGVVKKKLYQCNLCTVYFDSKEEFSIHQLNHDTYALEPKCRYCSESFSTTELLNTHIKEHLPGKSSTDAIYDCSYCSMKFTKKNELTAHVSSKHPEKDFIFCTECDEIFCSKQTYNYHIQKHKIVYDKECPKCLKKYTKHTIARHMNMHEHIENWDTKPDLMCDICGALLPNEKALTQHCTKHVQQRQCPYCQIYINIKSYTKHIDAQHAQNDKCTIRNCPHCNYTTKFGICLEAHINRHHLKVRPYKCDICDRGFYSDYTLKGHKATHQEGRSEHYCNFCGKDFKSRKGLVYHTRIHTGETPYPCELCDLHFLNASRRRQHMLRKHLDPQHNCKVCDKKFSAPSELKRHEIKCHNDNKEATGTKKAQIVCIPVADLTSGSIKIQGKSAHTKTSRDQ